MLTINELQGNKVVLTGDSLLDPVYLAQIAFMLKAFGATAAVNKVDYLYLQALHGGNIPDIDGLQILTLMPPTKTRSLKKITVI